MNNFMIRADGQVEVTCLFCKEKTVLANVTTNQIARWQAGEFVQRAMPQLSPAERELFISGTCGKCWEALFAGCEDDGEQIPA